MAGAGDGAGGAWVVIRRRQPALRAARRPKAHPGGGGARAPGGDRLRVAPRRRSGVARSQRAEENSDADAAMTWGGRSTAALTATVAPVARTAVRAAGRRRLEAGRARHRPGRAAPARPGCPAGRAP